MKRITRIAALMLICTTALAFSVSCSQEKALDGSSKETKKVMTQEEYKANSQAIRGLSIAEAYASVMADDTQKAGRSIASSGTYEYVFKIDDVVSTTMVKEALEKAVASPETTESAKKYYNALLLSLPQTEMTLSFGKGSEITYFYDEATGIRTVVSVDISLEIDGKEAISIEKDEDEKWIKIDSVYFDNTELEKMLEAADDAADAIEEFFENYKFDTLILDALLKGNETSIDLKVMDDEELETEIKGKIKFNLDSTNKSFSTYYAFSYTEYDGGKVEDEFTLEATIVFSASNITILDLDIEKLMKNVLDVNVKVNSVPIWSEAFIDELS